MSKLGRRQGISGKFLQPMELDLEFYDILVADKALIDLLYYEHPLRTNDNVDIDTIRKYLIFQRGFIYELVTDTHCSIFIETTGGRFNDPLAYHQWTIKIVIPDKREIISDTGERRMYRIAQRISELLEHEGFTLGMPTITSYRTERLNANHSITGLQLEFELGSGRQH
mgnify:FL=1